MVALNFSRHAGYILDLVYPRCSRRGGGDARLQMTAKHVPVVSKLDNEGFPLQQPLIREPQP